MMTIITTKKTNITRKKKKTITNTTKTKSHPSHNLLPNHNNHLNPNNSLNLNLQIQNKPNLNQRLQSLQRRKQKKTKNFLLLN